MTPKPPEGFETWLPWIEWILSLDPKCEVFAREPVEFLIAELAALRARVAELETSLAFEKVTIAVNKLTIYRLERQVAALADALAGLTASVYRCYEHNDALGDAMDLAKAALRAAGRKT